MGEKSGGGDGAGGCFADAWRGEEKTVKDENETGTRQQKSMICKLLNIKEIWSWGLTP
jgi:hypothetical protein